MKNLRVQNQEKSIKYGDAFRVGNHIVACYDARDRKLISKLVGETKIRAVIVDPPYAIRMVESKIGFSKIKVPKKILNDNISSETEYIKFTEDWISPILPHLASKNSFYVFNADPMIFALREGMKRSGVKFSQLLIWIKNQAVINRKDYLIQHELLAYGWYGRHEFLKSKDKSLLYYPKPVKNLLHPTQKPVGLIRRLILNSTKIGDMIYDCFAGSGTSAVAAEQCKRSSISIERDKAYCRTILERMEKLFGIKPKRIKL